MKKVLLTLQRICFASAAVAVTSALFLGIVSVGGAKETFGEEDTYHCPEPFVTPFPGRTQPQGHKQGGCCVKRYAWDAVSYFCPSFCAWVIYSYA